MQTQTKAQRYGIQPTLQNMGDPELMEIDAQFSEDMSIGGNMVVFLVCLLLFIGFFFH